MLGVTNRTSSSDQRKVVSSASSSASATLLSSSKNSSHSTSTNSHRRYYYGWKEFIHGILFCFVCQRLWDSVAVTKTMTTGGIGTGISPPPVVAQPISMIEKESTESDTEIKAALSSTNIRHGREAAAAATAAAAALTTPAAAIQTLHEELANARKENISLRTANEALLQTAAAVTAVATPATTTSSSTTTVDVDTVDTVVVDFKEIATATGTDKVAGHQKLPSCLANRESCTRPACERPECRPWGHFYDTIYTHYLGQYTTATSDPIQFLEIGFFQGKGFEAYTKYLNNNNNNSQQQQAQQKPHHDLHTMEISCIEEGTQAEGKWPWGNFAEKHPMYQSLLDNHRLHCGDASLYQFLKDTWDTHMHVPDKPPLMVVVDDASHVAPQMTISLFFWLPRLEPGGIFIMEDIQPISEANQFRTHVLPQVVKDLHWCGGKGDNAAADTQCYPQLANLLQGVHCEMHICVFIRNDTPSYEPNEEESMMPIDAITNAPKCLFGPHDN